ncbi:TRAP transporter permease [Mesobacillus maritimus]|uniref:TRAP transporter permease n=1 Tax=Mesobacillus maritimus TaxID=1643336 RepID=UPI00203C8A3C|nr:TRAP transporter permease [Mesobacillus maritimus]MCM3587304.1 TRAP transporter permease [Mesobacillus maritimus]MCM3667870.1 TRAP transporter permease [Mesobacillus maritimus]
MSTEMELVEKVDSEFRVRTYIGKAAKVLTAIAVIWSLFQIFAAGSGVFDAITLRAWHMMFLLVVTFLLYPITKKGKRTVKFPPVFDLICILLSIASTGYLLVSYQTIVLRGGYLLLPDYIFGAIGILMIFEAARRVVGNLAILAFIFLLYNFLGSYIPGIFGHGGFSVNRVIDYLFYGSEGVFGIAIGVSATFVFLFILFGAFLSRSGFSQFINDFALTIAGRSPGGPAKVAVIASSLMGMINGSALANVATTGTLTIPLMKKNGYKARFAAAVEAVASTGGQFAPPIMGAAGFVMAEYLGVSYTVVMVAAIIPAILYYLTLIMVVHFEAKRLGLKGLSKENIPKAMDVLKKQGHLSLPLIVLMGLLFMGYTPLYAAVFSIIACVVASWLRKETRMGLKEIILALEEGAKGAVGVAVACAVIGVIIGTVSLTGLGLNFGYAVMNYTNDSLLIAGLLVMLMSIILGMGVPGVAAYVIVATVGAPVLINLGVTPLAAHMFVLIYACLSNITPPVALASYVAAGIAGTNQNQVSLTAVKLGLTGFILPFFFIFNPALLLGANPYSESIIPAITAIIGCISLAAGLQGWFLMKANLIQRIIFTIVGVLMIIPGSLTDYAGIGLLGIVLAWQWVVKRKLAPNEMSQSI